MYTLQGQQHTTNTAISTVLPAISSATADAWGVTTITCSYNVPLRVSRIVSFGPFACGKSSLGTRLTMDVHICFTSCMSPGSFSHSVNSSSLALKTHFFGNASDVALLWYFLLSVLKRIQVVLKVICAQYGKHVLWQSLAFLDISIFVYRQTTQVHVSFFSTKNLISHKSSACWIKY